MANNTVPIVNTETRCDDDEEYERCSQYIRFYRPLIIRLLRPMEMLISGNFDNIIPRQVERKIYSLDREEQQELASATFIDAILESDDMYKWKKFRQEAQKPEHEMIQDILTGDIHDYLEIHDQFEKLVQCIYHERLVEKLELSDTMLKCHERSLLTLPQMQKVQAHHNNHGLFAANNLLLHYIPRTKNWHDTFLRILWETDQKHLVNDIDPDFYGKLLAQEKEMHKTGNFQEATYGDCSAQGNQPCVTEDFQESVMYDSGQPCSSPKLLCAQDAESGKVENILTGEGCIIEEKASQPLPILESTNVKCEESAKVEPNQADDGCTFGENLQPFLNITESPDVKYLGSKTILTGEAEKTYDLNIISTTELKQSQAISTADSDDESNLPVDSVLPEQEQIVTNKKQLTLRTYQSELAESACQGKNVIICAPTGSGKTIVSIHIITNHMASLEGKKGKVIFLVNQKALAEQQFSVLKDHLGGRYQCVQVSGDTELDIPFKTVVEKFDILVVTAQILVDALARGDVASIQVFSLIIFDECHHTKDKHPFNSTMLRYLKEKYPNIQDPQIVQSDMPQIVGLTASVGVGKAKTEESAVNHIRQLFANLDVDEICTVEKNKEELAKATNTAYHSVFPCPARGNDDFKQIVDTVMERIENEMAKRSRKLLIDTSTRKLPCSDKRWTPSYFQLISKMFKEFARISDNDLRRELESARRYLVIYYNALTINEDCRTKDAFGYLKEKMEKVEKDASDTFVPFEQYLHELYTKHTTVLENACTNDSSENPKLKCLHELISQCFQENLDSRIIVFVKTRELANALELWMKDTPFLKSLNAKKMVGACATAEKGGMTQRQQVDVMTSLREGKHKIIVATSVAQEGLDVPKCNMVIQYDYNTNEIAMVQARGRARAENSQYAVIASKDSSVGNKEIVNLEREKLMNEAIQTLKSQMTNDVEGYESKKREYQLGNLSTMILHENTRQQNIMKGEFKLTCEHCGHLACFTSDIRTIKGSQHVVIDPYFEGQIEVKVHPRPNSYSGLEKKGKLHCQKCSDEWGIVIKHKGHFYPVIKIEKFRAEDSLLTFRTFKSWKEVNFLIDRLELDENTCNIDSKCNCLLEH